jgi:hypothetical protein
VDTERLVWLKSIYPEFEDKQSFYENVYKPTDLIYHDFFIESKSYRGYVNPENIVGIEYGFAYNFDNEINWHELFIRLKRFKDIQQFKSKNEIINHVHNDYKEEKWIFKYGNNYFTKQGQHRLCLAKFLNIKSVEVDITEFKLDKPRLVRFKKLKIATDKLSKYGLCWEYSFKDLKESSKYEYFYLNKFKNSIRIKIDLLLQFIDYYEQFHIFKPLHKIQISLNNFLHPNRVEETIEISEMKDFKKANSSIILHKMGKVKQY